MLENYCLISIDSTKHNNIELSFVEVEFANYVLKQYKYYKHIFDKLPKEYIEPLNRIFFEHSMDTYEGSQFIAIVTKEQYKEIGNPKIGDIVNICVFMSQRN